MGRNSASQIFWTFTTKGAQNISTFYCQQHARWDVRQHGTPATASSALRAEIRDDHGNVEQ